MDIFFRFVDDERTMVALDVVIVTYNSAEDLPPRARFLAGLG